MQKFDFFEDFACLHQRLVKSYQTQLDSSPPPKKKKKKINKKKIKKSKKKSDNSE